MLPLTAMGTAALPVRLVGEHCEHCGLEHCGLNDHATHSSGLPNTGTHYRSRRSSVVVVSAQDAQEEADSLAELITDCAELPADLRTARPGLPLPRQATAWAISDACLAAVRELDEYV